MRDYKEFDRLKKDSALWDCTIDTLSVLPDRALQMLNLPTEVLDAIDQARNGDDTAGTAAGFFCLSLTNSPLTAQDRLVVGQTLATAGAAAITNKVASPYLMDSKDVLKNQDLFSNFIDWLGTAKDKGMLVGDAFSEAVVFLKDYYSQYNKDAEDTTFSVAKGSVGNSERVIIPE